MVNHVSDSKDIAPESIEKDWWVTTVLKVLFDLSISEYTFFKGVCKRKDNGKEKGPPSILTKEVASTASQTSVGRTKADGPTAVATSPWGCLSKGLSLTMQSNVQDLGANNKKAQ